MPHQFTGDDEGKVIVTGDGTHVGEIDGVDDDRATVKRNDDESLTDKVKDMLGWDDDDDEHEIRSEHIDRAEEDRLRLREH